MKERLKELETLYLGRKLKGFKFKSTGDLGYAEEMDECIGQEAVIECVDLLNKETGFFSFDVEFTNGGLWSYPFDEALEYLVPETPIDLNLLFEQIKSI